MTLRNVAREGLRRFGGHFMLFRNELAELPTQNRQYRKQPSNKYCRNPGSKTHQALADCAHVLPVRTDRKHGIEILKDITYLFQSSIANPLQVPSYRPLAAAWRPSWSITPTGSARQPRG